MSDEGEAIDRSFLKQSEMDRLCIGVGPGCVHCKNLLPSEDEPERVCQAITDIEQTHGIARVIHNGR